MFRRSTCFDTKGVSFLIFFAAGDSTRVLASGICSFSRSSVDGMFEVGESGSCRDSCFLLEFGMANILFSYQLYCSFVFFSFSWVNYKQVEVLQ